MAAVRADALHRFIAKLVRAHGVIVVEDLTTRNLMANRALAAAIGDQGWAELARLLQYKTTRHGGQLIAAANLAAWGEHALGICPCVIRAGDRHPGGPSVEGSRHACGGWVSGAAVPAAPVPPGEAGTSRPRDSVA